MEEEEVEEEEEMMFLNQEPADRSLMRLEQQTGHTHFNLYEQEHGTLGSKSTQAPP